MKFKTSLIPIALILISTLIGMRALLKNGYFTSHDGWHQVVRLHYFNKSLSEGVFPPTFVRDLYYEYGYPLFIFNYHLPWFLAQPFLFLGFDIFSAIKYVYILGYLLSGITMYLWLKNRFTPLASLSGALLYMWAPYRFLNIYVRGSIGEATIFIFLPLYFYALDKLRTKFSLHYLALGGLAFGSIVLSHAIVAMLILSVSMIYILILVMTSTAKKTLLSRYLILIIIGCLLSLYYLVPAIILKDSTQFDQRISATNKHGKYATIKELIYSKWGYGFATTGQPDAMSFQLGIAQWICLIMGIVVIVYNYKHKKTKNLEFAIGLLLISLITIYFITPQSEVIGNYLLTLFNVDYYWRLLTISVFATSGISAYVITNLPGKTKYIFCALIVLIALYTNRNHIRVNEYTNIPLSLYLSSEQTTNTYDEYLPQKANIYEIQKINRGSQIESQNNTTIGNYQKSINGISFDYTSTQEEEMRIHIFDFPGWQTYLDNKKIPHVTANFGLISINAQSGTHSVKVRYTGTRLMNISKIISLTVWVISIAIIIFPYIKVKKNE